MSFRLHRPNESSDDRPYLYISKDIKLTSTNPEDANATQIIGGFVIDNATRNLIIEGLTIRDAIYWKDYENGSVTGEQTSPPRGTGTTPQGSGMDGYGGGTCRGAGMQLNGAASPTVRNCLFVNCVARGIPRSNRRRGYGRRRLQRKRRTGRKGVRRRRILRPGRQSFV